METNRLADLGLNRSPEFQVIIIIEYDDGRMFPLTEEIPKSLLPIANRPLLAYQLDLLEKSGAIEVYIVAPQDYKLQLSQFLFENLRDRMSVELVVVDEMLGSCDALRAVHDRIRGDFIVIGSDAISELNIGRLVNSHRMNTSDITSLFSTVIAEEAEKKGGPKKLNIDEEDQEYIGVCDDNRIVMKLPALELDENITISKPLLRHCSGLTIRNDLIDIGIYIFSHWILECVCNHKTLSSIRTDLLPYIINRQFQPVAYLDENIPGFKHRRRPLSSLETWLVSSQPQAINPRTMSTASQVPDLAVILSNYLSGDNYDATAVSASPASASNASNNYDNAHKSSSDPLRCFGVILEESDLSNCICQRMTNIQAYLNSNRDISAQQLDDKKHLWAPVPGYRKKEQSAVGDGCELGDKVTIKLCSIGHGCKIGPRSKVNSCVLMAGVQIGESCTIQNSVICDGAVIESNCNLNECYIGKGTRVPAGSKLKSEALSSAGNA